jgi:hypothetical protein
MCNLPDPFQNGRSGCKKLARHLGWQRTEPCILGKSASEKPKTATGTTTYIVEKPRTSRLILLALSDLLMPAIALILDVISFIVTMIPQQILFALSVSNCIGLVAIIEPEFQ